MSAKETTGDLSEEIVVRYSTAATFAECLAKIRQVFERSPDGSIRFLKFTGFTYSEIISLGRMTDKMAIWANAGDDKHLDLEDYLREKIGENNPEE